MTKLIPTCLLLILGFGFTGVSAQASLNSDARKIQEEILQGKDTKISVSERKKIEEALNQHSQTLLFDERARFEDVVTWNAMGGRYAIGYDQMNRPVGIFDLAYPNIFSKEHFPRTVLGAIGTGNLNLKNIIDSIKEGLSRSKGFDKSSSSKIETFLNKASDQKGEVKAQFPKNWWKSVKWKNKALSTLSAAPKAFRVSDIDLRAMSKSKTRFDRHMKKFIAGMSDIFGVESNFDFFNHFELVQQNGDGYQIFFINEKNKDDVKFQERPVIVADLVAYQSSYWKGIKTFFMIEAIETAVGLVSAPVVGGILDTIVSRWFRLYKQQAYGHQMAALEHLNNAHLGDHSSPFATLNNDEKMRAGMYLTNYDLSGIGILKKLFMNRKRTWEISLMDDIHETNKSRVWVKDNAWTENNLGFWFTQSTRGEQHRIFLLGQQWPLTDKPMTGVNYNDPKAEIRWRTSVETVKIALSLIKIEPVVSTAIKAVFHLAVTRQIRNSQNWEARLISYLQNRGAVSHENWDSELSMLYDRRLNPFEFTRAEEDFVIRTRREHIGIDTL